MRSSIDLTELIRTASPISQAVLVVLLLMSVFSWAVILYKWRLFRNITSQDERFLTVYEALDNPAEVRRRTATIARSPMADLFAVAYRHIQAEDRHDPSTYGVETEPSRGLERVLRQASERHLMLAEEYLATLATVGNVAPFVGLFGTVLGIIQAFHAIGLQGTASIAAVAPGVAEALVATAAGLFAAIPAVIGYNYFLTRLRRHSVQLDMFRQDLVAVSEARVRPASVGSGAVRKA